MKQAASINMIHADCCMAYSFTLKMEAKCFSDIFVEFERTTRHYIPENKTLHTHRCEHFDSYNQFLVQIFVPHNKPKGTYF
jgi:hypothetical protein